MPRFRKLPVTVEAHQWFQNGDHPDDGDGTSEGMVVRYYRHPGVDGEATHGDGWEDGGCGNRWHDHGWIDTLEGGHAVCPSDWIITGVVGERYPCKAGIFDATYEPFEGDDAVPEQ